MAAPAAGAGKRTRTFVLHSPRLRAEPKAVCFDLDDTLWATAPVLESAGLALHVHLQREWPQLAAANPPPVLLEALVQAKASAECAAFAHDFTRLRKHVLAAAATAAGLDPADVVEPAFAVWHAARNRVTLFDGALDALLALRSAGYAICTITNGNAQPATIPGLAELGALHVSAISAGAAKPAAAAFEAAARGLGLQPEQIVHVGDDLLADVAGAARAGMGTIWVRHGAASLCGSDDCADRDARPALRCDGVRVGVGDSGGSAEPAVTRYTRAESDEHSSTPCAACVAAPRVHGDALRPDATVFHVTHVPDVVEQWRAACFEQRGSHF
jgi:putative hydrolase of the HAD superfamily